MLNIVAKLVSEWNRHATYGVAALAHTFPRNGWNGQAADPAPPTLFDVVCDRDFPDMMETLDPPPVLVGRPCWAIWINDTTRVEWKSKKAHAVDLVASWCTPPEIDAAVAVSNAGYILRAGQLCMSLFENPTLSDPQAGPSYRQLNGVRIMEVLSCEQAQRTATSRGKKTKFWGFLDITVVVIDGAMKLPVLPAP